MARRNQAKEEGDEGKSSERRSKGLENALHARDRVQCLKDEVANVRYPFLSPQFPTAACHHCTIFGIWNRRQLDR